MSWQGPELPRAGILRLMALAPVPIVPVVGLLKVAVLLTAFQATMVVPAARLVPVVRDRDNAAPITKPVPSVKVRVETPAPTPEARVFPAVGLAAVDCAE